MWKNFIASLALEHVNNAAINSRKGCEAKVPPACSEMMCELHHKQFSRAENSRHYRHRAVRCVWLAIFALASVCGENGKSLEIKNTHTISNPY
jgi:hypothetical protein